jgi:hypothetical protein
MKLDRLLFAVLSALLLLGTTTMSKQHQSKPKMSQGAEAKNVSARLIGFDETPANVTPASGDFSATIDDTAQTITYTLTFTGLEGTTTASHIHVAQPDVAGGISAFLCGGGSKPACPGSGTVTGTIVAADVIGPVPQGVNPGDFAKLIQAIEAGKAYVNVHSSRFPGGEIRGQIKPGEGDGSDN